MYRVMIVDDDAIIRRGLSCNIPWEDWGFQLVGTAGDGEEGVRLFLQSRPEIVISDIKMPFLDGLDLSRRLLEESPETKIILLTGYEEFDYAKQALELKVFDYILKPVEFNILLQTLQRAAAVLDNERKVKWQIQESRPLLKQRFLTRLIYGKHQSERELLDEAAFLELEIQKEWFITVLIKLDDYQNPKIFPGVTEQEIAKIKLANLCRERLEDGAEVLDPGGDELVLIFCSNLKPGQTTQDVLEWSESLLRQANESLALSITIGIGSVRPSLLEIADSFREAKSAVGFRHIFGKNQVLTIGDTGMPNMGEPVDLPEIREELRLKVKLGLTADAVMLLDEIEAGLLRRKFIALPTAQLIGTQLALLLLQEAQDWEDEETQVKKGFSLERCHCIQEGQTIQEIFAELRRLATEVSETINQRRETMQEGLVGQAVHFIEENYYQEGLSLSDVAQAVHVSPVYLSIMFKKERNINFSGFLTEVRMRKAMELLRGSDLKSYEVSERVGYSNPQYFSVCFKKYTGCSPSEFKNK